MRLTRSVGSVATVVVTLCLLFSTVGGPAHVAAAQGAHISITDVSHSPQAPTAGSTFEIQLTIQNQGGASDRSVTINEVYAQTPGTKTYYANDLGTLASGGSMTVTVPAKIDDPGWHTVEVKVNGIDSGGNIVSIKHPVTVQVVPPQKPQLEIALENGVADTESRANVTVANGLSAPIRNLRLQLDGPGASVTPSTRVNSKLPAGTERTFAFTVTPESVGAQQLTATLEYTDESGGVETVLTRDTFDVERLDRRVQLDVNTVSGETPAAEVTITNLGNAPLKDLAVTADSQTASVSTALLDRVSPRESQTVRLNVTDITAAETKLTVRVRYEISGTEREITGVKKATFVPGQVELTGIDAALTENADAVARITGTASNVGTTAVSAVTIRVHSTKQVSPANPGKEYFVGQIDNSDFASFAVNARLADPASETTIPLEVSYLVDGQRRQTMLNATYEPSANSTQRGGGLVVQFMQLAAVSSLLAIGVFARRNLGAD